LPEEFEIMKKHTLIGAKMLERSHSSILNMASEIALCHHERWDGTGYPRGLSGADIPESARIVSVVDVFDALSHDRVYRHAFPDDHVLSLMNEGCGTQFDPSLLAAFLANYDAFCRIAQESPDEDSEDADSLSLFSFGPLATSNPVDLSTVKTSQSLATATA
jgi:putative two-component system response regulator